MHEVKKIKKFVRWLKNNGGIFQKVMIGTNLSLGGIRGIIAAELIESEIEIMKLPLQILMYAERIYEDDEVGSHVAANMDLLSDGYSLLTLYVMQELRKGRSSFFSPYLNSIPRPNGACDWNEEDLTELQDPAFVRLLKIRTEALEKRLPEVFPEAYFNLERFKFSMWIILSRVFESQLPWPALIPLADLLNHSSSPQTRYDFNVDGSDHLTMYSTSPLTVSPSSELFANYGSRSNEAFLKEFGFAVLNNSADQVEVYLSVPVHHPRYERKKTYLGGLGMQFSCLTNMRLHEVPWEALNYLRCLALSDVEIELQDALGDFMKVAPVEECEEVIDIEQLMTTPRHQTFSTRPVARNSELRTVRMMISNLMSLVKNRVTTTARDETLLAAAMATPISESSIYFSLSDDGSEDSDVHGKGMSNNDDDDDVHGKGMSNNDDDDDVHGKGMSNNDDDDDGGKGKRKKREEGDGRVAESSEGDDLHWGVSAEARLRAPSTDPTTIVAADVSLTASSTASASSSAAITTLPASVPASTAFESSKITDSSFLSNTKTIRVRTNQTGSLGLVVGPTADRSPADNGDRVARVKVFGFTEGSVNAAAKAAGIEVGDVIEAVNSQTASTTEGVIALMKVAQTNGSAEVVLTLSLSTGDLDSSIAPLPSLSRPPSSSPPSPSPPAVVDEAVRQSRRRAALMYRITKKRIVDMNIARLMQIEGFLSRDTVSLSSTASAAAPSGHLHSQRLSLMCTDELDRVKEIENLVRRMTLEICSLSMTAEEMEQVSKHVARLDAQLSSGAAEEALSATDTHDGGIDTGAGGGLPVSTSYLIGLRSYLRCLIQCK